MKLKIGLVILLGLIILQGIIFSRYIANVDEAKKLVRHTYEVIDSVEVLYNDLMDYKNEQLEMIIKGNVHSSQSTLANFKVNKNAEDKIYQSIQKIQVLTQDNTIQRQNVVKLDQQIKDNLALLNKANTSHAVKTSIDAVADSNRGFRRNVRATIDQIISEEKRLLNLRVTNRETAEKMLITYISIAGLFCYSALLGLLFLFMQTHKKLSEKEARLNLAVQGSSDGLWDWDPNTNEVFFSSRFKEMLNYSDKEMKNNIKVFKSLIHPHDVDRFWSLVQEHLEKQTPFNIEFQMYKKNGDLIWVQSRGQATWNKQGKPIRMSAFITDITLRKEAERLKNEFISTVSHELRTPLTSIRGSLGLLLAGVGGTISDKMHNLVEIAHKNCERLIFLINDILDLEKIESGQMRFEMQWCSLNECIMQAIEQNEAYSEKFNVRLVVKEPLSTARVYVDNNRLIQVLTNLISNAVKFSSSGNSVEISTIDYKHTVRVMITDHGAGIPDEFRKSIFNKFAQADSSTTKQRGGTGLGLNISQAILKRFGGQINYESEVNKGSTFYFELPIFPAPELSVISDITPKTRLLVCEDDVDIAHFLKNILEEQDFQVDIAFNAQQAKELLDTYTYAGLTLDLILPDENGIMFIQQLRNQEKTKNLPIIVVSARAEEGKSVMNGHTIGIVDWLTKPIDQTRLIAAIKKISSSSRIPRILYVEDDQDLVSIINYSLNNIAEVLHASTLAQARKYLSVEQIDLVLLDLSLPDGSGLQLLENLDGPYPKPVIIFSASEVTAEVSKKVAAALVKSHTSEETLVLTLKNFIAQHVHHE